MGRKSSTRISVSSNTQHRNPDVRASVQNDDDDTQAALDFSKVLQEVEGGFQITWKEIILVLCAM